MKILTYTSDTTDQSYDLRDVLDFRPRVDDASTINSGGQDRSFDGTGLLQLMLLNLIQMYRLTLNITYLELDKIFLDKDGTFREVEGDSVH